MNADRYYRALLSIVALVVHCALMSAAHWLMNDWWLTCCHLLMQVTRREIVWFATVTRASFIIPLMIGFSLLSIRLWKTCLFIARLTASTTSPSSRLARLTDPLGLSPHIVVLRTDMPLAFCFGLLRPRICLSTGLMEALADLELQAVLLHEDHHRRHYDPLRTLLVDVISLTLFFLPITRELRNMFILSAELEADRYAARRLGRPSLAGALYKLLSHPPDERFPQTVGLSGLSLTDAHHIRIAELLGDPTPPQRFSLRSLIVSSIILVLGCLLASALLA